MVYFDAFLYPLKALTVT